MEKQENNKKLISRLVIASATIFGAGFVPKFSGTLGSIIACLYFWFIPQVWLGVSILFFLLVAWLVCTQAEILLEAKDPKPVIIDDFSGMLIALLPATKDFWDVLLCFLLFSIFDGLKVYPVDILEKKRGSLGIVGDDVIAGVYAMAVFYSARVLVNILK